MTDTNDPMLVWNNTVDGTYPVEVIRTEPYKGLLRVWGSDAKDGLLHQQAVGLSYDALFGPDVSDVDQWQSICTDVIDNPEKREVPDA